jgi:large subunit ribosomal protein L18
MMDKKQSRLRRGRQTRAKIAELKVNRLAVHRTNLHIYATIISPDAKVLASASTLEAEVRQQLAGQTGKGGNAAAAALIGKRVAEKALKAGIAEVAFDRSGFRYHGRAKEESSWQKCNRRCKAKSQMMACAKK